MKGGVFGLPFPEGKWGSLNFQRDCAFLRRMPFIGWNTSRRVAMVCKIC